MFNAYLHAEQNSRLPWMSVWFGVDFTENIYLETYIKLNFELEQYNNNNNDRLTAFDPGQPG